MKGGKYTFATVKQREMIERLAKLGLLTQVKADRGARALSGFFGIDTSHIDITVHEAQGVINGGMKRAWKILGLSHGERRRMSGESLLAAFEARFPVKPSARREE